MKVQVENVKLSVLGRAFGPEGGTRAPYTLFSGEVSIEYLTTKTLPVGEFRTEEPVKIYGLKLAGKIMADGAWHRFEYAALSNAAGKTLRHTGEAEWGTDTWKFDSILVPTGSDYPYPTLYGWKDWEKAIAASNPDPAGDWYGRPQGPAGSWEAPWEHMSPGLGYLRSETGLGMKMTTKDVVPGTEGWCLLHLLAENVSTFRAYYHPTQGVRRSEIPVTEDGWKQLPPFIGKDYHIEEAKRTLVFRKTDWLNVDTSLAACSSLEQLLRENKAAKAATEDWYAS